MSSKILIVENQRHIGRLVQINLERAGFRVETAVTSDEGFKQAEVLQPDMIVIGLPIEDRDGLLSRLKESPLTSQTPRLWLGKRHLIPPGEDKQRGELAGVLLSHMVAGLKKARSSLDAMQDSDWQTAVARLLVMMPGDELAEQVMRALRNAGYIVRLVENRQEVEDTMIWLKPNLFIIDLGTPVFEGFEILKRLKSEPALATIPVLAICENAGQSIYRRPWVFGFGARRTDGYLVKPFEMGELAQMVRELLERRKPPTPPSSIWDLRQTIEDMHQHEGGALARV